MKQDRIASAIFFLVGLVIAREGLRMPYMAGFTPGPGFFPLWIGGGLMLLSAILFLTTRSAERPFVENLRGFRKASLVAISLLVYIFALSYLGLLVALAILLAFLVGKVEGRSWRTWAAVAVLGSLGCYLLFEVWLRVPLPIGILGI